MITIKKIFREEALFFIILIIAVLTSLYIPIHFEVINWKVIFSLFNLMLISLSFEKYNMLDLIASKILNKANSQRQIGVLMIFTTSILAMFITNDIALISVVPLTLTIGKRADFNPFKIIVLETLSANIGSSLTPFGNPQNLFLYSYFKISTFNFLNITFIFVVLGLIYILILSLFISNNKIHFEIITIHLIDIKKLILMLILFILIILSILRVLNFYYITLLVIFIFIIFEREMFLKIDYFLLGTFLCFFIAIDNIQNIKIFNTIIVNLLQTKYSTFLISGILSQFISNVPAAIFVSGFSDNIKAILLGVSVGGMGTLIASMANLISYKFYIKQFNANNYRSFFYKTNFAGFIIFMIIFYFLL